MRSPRLSVSVLVVGSCLVGCGDDETAGTTGSPTDPGISAADCPAAPVVADTEAVAPYWLGGLVALQIAEPTGHATGFEVQVFDPAYQGWRASYASTEIEPGPPGAFLLGVAVNANERNQDGTFKLRVRSLLDGCAPSDWAESGTFELRDPVAGTSWEKTFDPPAYFAFSGYATGGGTSELTYEGPYQLADDPPPSHRVAFADDGVFKETFTFALESENEDDAYAGCTFELHYQGTWRLDLDLATIFLSERRPSAKPTEGSKCTSPALADLAIAGDDFHGTLAAESIGWSVDNARLLESPAGAQRLSLSQLSDNLFATIPHLAVVEGDDANQISASGYFTDSYYDPAN